VRVVKQPADAPTRTLATLHEGAIFGEMALLTDAPRSASVIAATDCELLEFDRDALLLASGTVSHLTHALATFAQDRLLANLLSTAALFKPLEPQQRHDLMRRFVAVHAEPGNALILEGEQGTGLHVVLRGEVMVTRVDGGQDVELARLGPGETFGEISLIEQTMTTATVTATQPTTVLFLGRDYFERLISAVPAIGAYLKQLSEDRMLDTRISLMPDEPSLSAIIALDLDLDGAEEDVDIDFE
jgi:cAMP-dependent protein kinase regulator